ncbi:MAG: magnesium transporter [Verrucomicrobiota bacterium]
MEKIDELIIDVKDPQWIESLKQCHPADIAEQTRSIPVSKIREVLRQLPDELTAEVIAEYPIEMSVQLFETMRLNRLSGIIGEMFTDDAADVLGQLSAKRLNEIMGSLNPEDAAEMRSLLKYPEDSAGGTMQTEFIALSESLSVAEATEKLRTHEEINSEDLFYIYVIDEDGRLRGVLRVRDLLFSKADRMIEELMDRDVRCVSVHADQEEVATLFQRYHFNSIPVVDDFQRLQGIILSDDVIEIVQEEATEDMQRMVGLSGEEMLDTSWRTSVRNRLPWLCVNLATAFAAGLVVSIFEETIAQYAVLAIFLPIIAGQGGNAGTQTLTILVRSLALSEVSLQQQRAALVKEVVVGLINGISIGLIVGLVSWVWKGNLSLGIITCLAMALNMLVAAVAGVLIPLGLKSLKIDPALASAIMLTTVTDVIGFFVFLGLAALGMQFFPQYML